MFNYNPHPPAPLPKGEGRVSRRFAGHFTIMALTPSPSPKGRGESKPKICRSFHGIFNYNPHPPAPLPKGEGRVSRRFAGHFTIMALTPQPLSQRERGEQAEDLPVISRDV